MLFGLLALSPNDPWTVIAAGQPAAVVSAAHPQPGAPINPLLQPWRITVPAATHWLADLAPAMIARTEDRTNADLRRTPLPALTDADHTLEQLADGFMADLFGLGVRTLVIDPGHGGKDLGAVGASGLAEKDIVLEVARGLRDRLQARGPFRVLMTREDDTFRTLKERVEYANEQQADLFISIHVNALPEPWHAFVETYYFGAPADAATERLAKAENEGSDYAMSEFRAMIARIGDTFKQQESRRLAALLQEGLYRGMQQHDRKIVDRGIQTAPFVVLLGTQMPSVLVEISSITNAEEESRLATTEYRDQIAHYLDHSIAQYLEDHQINIAKGATNNGSDEHDDGRR